MSPLFKPLRRLWALFRRQQLDAEMSEEMRQHLELRTEREIAHGLSPDEARRAALRTFGGMEQIQERCRDVRGWPWVEQFFQDLSHATRGLRKNPGFTAVATLALALGIGANTAIFSVVHGVLLRPLPYPAQERLVVVNESTDQQPNLSLSFPNFVDWRVRQRSFVALGVARSQSFNDAGPGGAERVAGAQVSHDLLTALAVAPLRGRLFVAADDRPGAEPTVLIRESYWRRRFGGHDSAIGERIQLTGVTHTIVGVMPDAVQWPAQAELWVPLGLSVDHPSYQNRSNHPGLYAVGRLKPGVTLDAARADLHHVAAQLAQEFPATNAGQSAALQSLPDRTFGSVAPMLYLLLGAAGFVLLIACANVANLQLARAHARAREFALRAALGAGRGRLVRQLLAESLLLGALGCIAGLLLGGWALGGLCAALPSNLPRLAEISLDGSVLGFASVAGLLTSAAFGLIPALQASKLDLCAALASGGRTAATGHRWQAWLIVGEFALTSVLLVGAGLMLRTLANLYRADPGFDTARIVTFTWALPATTTHADPAKRIAVTDQALARLAAVPGVQHVSIVSPLPLGGTGNNGAFYVEGAPVSLPGAALWCERAHISPGYFDTLGIVLLAGRTFDARDTLAAPKVAIIDADFAAKHFPRGDAIGRRFTYGNKPPAAETDWHHIVGVVAHIRNTGPTGTTRLQTYVPYTQLPPVTMSFAVATDLAPTALVPALRAAMCEVDSTLPIFGESTLDALFAANIATPRLTSMLLGAFAALALLLAAFGLYGVLSYNVGQRTREIGVRLALGASPWTLVQLIVRQGLKLAGLGLVIGLLAAFGLTQLLASVLFGVSSFDPASFATMAALLLAIGAAACWLPARRAAKVDPMVALRAE